MSEARRLIADGNTGRVAIQYGNSRRAFETPIGNLDQIHFHSDLDYLRIEQRLDTYLSFARVAKATRTINFGSKKGKKGDDYRTIPDLRGGQRNYTIGTVYGSANAPLIAFLGNTQLGASTVVHWQRSGGKHAGRVIGAAISGGNLVIREVYQSFGLDIPEQTFRIRLFKFSELIQEDPNIPYTLRIEPERFIASQGKLDSQNRYVRRVANPAHVLFTGRTMDVRNGGFTQARTDGGRETDGIYNGSWEPGPTIGVDT